MTPDLYAFFLKGIITVHEKNLKIFIIRFFSVMIYSKNKFQFSTNGQNISCSILSQHGINTKLAHF